jgi:hypothetical protein
MDLLVRLHCRRKRLRQLSAEHTPAKCRHHRGGGLIDGPQSHALVAKHHRNAWREQLDGPLLRRQGLRTRSRAQMSTTRAA